MIIYKTFMLGEKNTYIGNEQFSYNIKKL